MSTAATTKKRTRSLSPYEIRQRRQRWLLVASALLMLLAWVYGYVTNGTEIAPLVMDVLPTAERVEQRGSLFVGLNGDEVVGYAAVGQAPGYGGPIEVLVGVDPAGTVTGFTVVEHHETPGFFRLVQDEAFAGQFDSRPVGDPFRLGEDLDGVSGATYSAEGIAAAVREAVRTVADDGLNDPLPPEQKPVRFGLPEITLIALYALGYVGHKVRGNNPWKSRIRWGTLLVGMIVLGFIYTAPLTIAQVISLLSGYWPDWHNNLYWYLLIGGIVFVTTTQAKNPYCHWFCPFGAFQECLAILAGAKLFRPRRWHTALTWLQRGLAVVAILLGLALRRPGIAGYEPFAALFDLRGTATQWALLGLVTLASLLVYRPFCNYLCPLDPVVDAIGATRKWVKESWKKWRKTPANA